MAELTLKEFIDLPITDIFIEILKYNSSLFVKTTYDISIEILSTKYNYVTSKRYTEFQGFYDSLSLRYKNLKFPTFPSKFQMLNKQEYRKQYFENLFSAVLSLANQHVEIRKDLMKLLFEFIYSGEKGIVKTKDNNDKRKISLDSAATAPNLKSLSTIDTSDSKSIYTSNTSVSKLDEKVV